MACRLNLAENGFDDTMYNSVLLTCNVITNNLNLLPSLEDLQSLELSYNQDAFLEILIMSVKNSSLSHQHDFLKIQNARRKYLEKKLCSLKKKLK
jgi:hypothetical protein